MALLGVVLAVLCLLSLALGAANIPPDQVIRALFGDAPSRFVDNVVWTARVPRTALALAAGAALGLAGALMQALTHNPLADPGVLGVSAGASFAIVLAVGVLGINSLYGYVWFAFAGALIATVAVYLLGGLGRSGMTPVKLALAGIAVTSMLWSFTQAIVLTDVDALNKFRFWSAGSLADADNGMVWRVLPFLVIGAVLALACAPALNSLALGDDVAASLGGRPQRVRLTAAVAAALLASSAAALAGLLGFLGLVIPHLVRLAGGTSSHRFVIPASAVAGAGLLVAGDTLSRVVLAPIELPVGPLMVVLGVPLFLWLLREAV